MSLLLQDLIVSLVALGAITAIGLRARAMFAFEAFGRTVRLVHQVPAPRYSDSDRRPDNRAERSDPRIIRLTVIPGGAGSRGSQF